MALGYLSSASPSARSALLLIHALKTWNRGQSCFTGRACAFGQCRWFERSDIRAFQFGKFLGLRQAAGQRCGLPERLVNNVSLILILGVSDGRPTEMEGTSEMKKYLLASVLLVGFAGSAYAVTGQFDNMCSWGLANHKDVKTDCSVNATIKGSTYCFSSQDAKTNFMKSPDANLKKAETFYKSEHKG